MFRRFLACFVSLGLALLPRAARAQTDPPPALSATPPPAPAVSPPVVQGNTDVPYPSGAQGDATVVLVLDIDRDGHVSNAIVSEGSEPFAEQARHAVLGWTFTPALRGTKPVGARIRARVEFHQDPASAPTAASSPNAPPAPGAQPGSTPDATSPASASGAAAAEPAVEITVLGVRHEIGETKLSAADVREMPGAFGDPFRAIEALPSVVPMVSGLPFFYIRGAPPTNNSYLLDGIRVPLLFHVGIGEGVIHPALIDRVDFYPGAAPAFRPYSAGAAPG